MDLQLVACSDDKDWDGFVDHSQQGTVFCKSAFLWALGKKLERWFVKDTDIVVAAFPVLFDDKQPIVAPHPYTLYQGLMFHENVDTQPSHRSVLHRLEIADFLLSKLSSTYSLISLCTHPTLIDIRSFLWFNFHEPEKGQFVVDTRYTARLCLADFQKEQYLKEIRTLRRREIIRAQKAGYEIVINNDITTLDHLHDLTFRRQNLNRSSRDVDLLRNISEVALTYGLGRSMKAVSPKGEIASANLILRDRQASYYLFGANDPDFRSSGASSLLMFEAIAQAAEEGRDYFDFIGINSPNRGDYKVSFNAQPALYHTLTWQKPTSAL